MIRRGRHDVSQSFADAWDSSDLEGANGEVRELVALAERICRSVDAEPTPQFTSQLRERILLEAQTLEFGAASIGDPATSRVRRSKAQRTHAQGTRVPRRRLGQLAAAAVAAVSLAGTAVASAQAVPGYALYPVKRGIENVQLAMADGGVDRGAYQLQRAELRLSETMDLQSNGDDTWLVSTSLEDFSDQANKGASELLDSYAEQPSEATMERLDDFVAESTQTLDTLADGLPAAAMPALNEATTQVEIVASRAADLCRACAMDDLPNLVSSPSGIDYSGSVTQPDGSETSADSDSDTSRSSDGDQKKADANKTDEDKGKNPSASGPGQIPGGLRPDGPRVVIPTPTPPGPLPQPKPDPTSPPSGPLLGSEGLIPGLVGVLIPGLQSTGR